jgi:hypothetical protein
MAHTVKFAMPVIAAPGSGTDPETYYSGLSTAPNLNVSIGTTTEWLDITLDPAYKELYAFTGGVAFYIPSGDTLPLSVSDVSTGAGTLILMTHTPDLLQMNSSLQPGMMPAAYIVYKNVKPDTVKDALRTHVQALPEPILSAAWSGASGPSRTDLEENFLNQLVLGLTEVLVEGSTYLGDAEHVDPADTSSDVQFQFYIIDGAGNLVTPILYLQNLPTYGGNEWTGHPLIAATDSLPVTVDVYLRFEVYNLTTLTFDPLPAGVTVELVDSNTLGDTALDTLTTDANGQVHFQIADRKALSEPEPDLYFLVKPAGISHAGHTLPDEWSTSGWTATDGSAGYYDNFAGSNLGSSTSPLVFRIGVDYHLRITYKDERMYPGGSTPAADFTCVDGTVSLTQGSADVRCSMSVWGSNIVGMTFKVPSHDEIFTVASVSGRNQLTLDRVFSGATLASSAYHLCVPTAKNTAVSVMVTGTGFDTELVDAEVDDRGELHGVTFDLAAGAEVYFKVEATLGDSAINLPQCEVYEGATSVFVAGWESNGLEEAQVYFPANASTSLGSHDNPAHLYAANGINNVALFALKTTYEWSVFLFKMTKGDWPGLTGLDIYLSSASGTSYSWPVSTVNMAPRSYWERGTIIHELSHQIMWILLDIGSLGIVTSLYPIGDLNTYHRYDLIINPTHAFIEGWAYFFQSIFTATQLDPFFVKTRTMTDNNTGSTGLLSSFPANSGESAEGAVAGVLYQIYYDHVLTPAAATQFHLTEHVSGDITQSNAVLNNTPVFDRFVDLVWNPFKSLTTGSLYPIRDYYNAIRSAVLSTSWHQMLDDIQTFNSYMEAPVISTITPNSGNVAGSDTIVIIGNHFPERVTTVTIGGQPATGVTVNLFNDLTAVTPAGSSAGAVDVVVTTPAGSDTAVGGFTYV